MVEILGQSKLLAWQNSSSSGSSLSLPRFGCSHLRRLISAMTASGHNRFLLVLGVFDFSFKASGLLSPVLNCFFQLKRVRLFTLKASRVASRPYFCQKAKTLALWRAFWVIIYRYLKP